MIQIHQLDLKNIKRHETELKWINFLQSPFVKVLMITSTMKVTFLKYQILMFFSVFVCKKRKSRSHGKRKYGNIKRKICTEKTLKYFS